MTRPIPHALPPDDDPKKVSVGRVLAVAAVATLALTGAWWSGVRAVTPPPLPNITVLTSEPPGAEVYAEDALLGNTPLALMPEHTDVTLKKEGYQVKPLTVLFDDLKVKKQVASLQPFAGTVNLVGLPLGSKISIDGAEPVDFGDLPAKWDVGEHKVTVLVPDRDPVEMTINVELAGSVDLGAQVAKELASKPNLVLVVPKAENFKAELWLEGSEEKLEESGSEKVRFKLDQPGKYRLRVTADGFETHTRSLEVDGPKKLAVMLKAKPKPKPTQAPPPPPSNAGPAYVPPAQPRYNPPPRPSGGGGHRIQTPNF